MIKIEFEQKEFVVRFAKVPPYYILSGRLSATLSWPRHFLGVPKA